MSPADGRRMPQRNSESTLSASSRSRTISDHITKALFEGKWLPGDRIKDDELSNELQVSRISVREALSFLVERRVVEKVHWKGYYVRKLSLEEIESIVEVRISLEELAIEKLLARNPPGIFDEMDKVIRMTEVLAETNSYAEYMDTDFRFHELIYEGSGNVWIGNIIRDIRIHLNILRNLSMRGNFIEAARKSTDDHRRLLEQLRKGDKAAVMDILHAHFATHLDNIRAAAEQPTRD